MKKSYPKRPKIIDSNRIQQLWLIVPFCIFIFFCKGGGVVGSLLVLGIWIVYSINQSQKEWEEACDKGVATFYCDENYLKNQGYKEHHMSHIEEIKYVIVDNKEKERRRLDLERKKKILENMIYDWHYYKSLRLRWDLHCDKIVLDTTIEQEMLDIYYQIKDRRFKYMDEKVYNEYFIKYNTASPYATDIYLYILVNNLQVDGLKLFKEIMNTHNKMFRGFSFDEAYVKLEKGADIYE